MLQTWTEIQNHFRAKYTLENDKPTMFSMTWMYDDGRTQKVILRKFNAFDREMLEIKSPFAEKDQIASEVLMRQNSELPLATTALSGDVYLVVYNMLIGGRTSDDLELIVGRVAAIADALEQKHVQTDQF